MENVPYSLVVLFMIIFGLSTWILSWAIKRLRKALHVAEKGVKDLDRRLKREEDLSERLAATLQEHNVKFDEVDAIFEEMRLLHNSS
ncbi:coil containing protein [Vibrio phage 409E50-1]|nr:coil containing protein [Vibrio phage 464E53-1]CAH9012511.1 coil containing protein [Vibrio phage 521E56-1]CAH9012627.1 coil containing protein [Vibrio phage 384E50-1]CAH9012678.1 coil containing protein [Vibrio phage 402E50-1]CAH9012680.1 coil containing protein [Vibrio phage 409E50-1]CAH9013580.1 coil containing protein [Vibrio phage 405E50-1]CAH9013643.1 coil containing protein [Vibrio phage 413E50-1]CAH9015618.1 coil containing protein [Vibrio phage 468E53-1]CAH9015717.1 coil contain